MTVSSPVRADLMVVGFDPGLRFTWPWADHMPPLWGCGAGERPGLRGEGEHVGSALRVVGGLIKRYYAGEPGGRQPEQFQD